MNNFYDISRDIAEQKGIGNKYAETIAFKKYTTPTQINDFNDVYEQARQHATTTYVWIIQTKKGFVGLAAYFYQIDRFIVANPESMHEPYVVNPKNVIYISEYKFNLQGLDTAWMYVEKQHKTLKRENIYKLQEI